MQFSLRGQKRFTRQLVAKCDNFRTRTTHSSHTYAYFTIYILHIIKSREKRERRGITVKSNITNFHLVKENSFASFYPHVYKRTWEHDGARET